MGQETAFGENRVSRDPETIGDRVRKVRESRHISRAALARQAGIHRATVYRLETTPLYAPDRATVQRLAWALGVTVGYLQAGNWNNDTSELAAWLARDGRLDGENRHIMACMFDALLRLQQVERNLVWNRFVRDRDVAFGSLDEGTIRRFYEEYSLSMQKEDDAFWIDVHEIRSGMTSLPPAERRRSEAWLRARGLVGLDDDYS
jgi:transcriptional regulator with XRE-family HTH domain